MTEYGSGPCIRIIPRERRSEVIRVAPVDLSGIRLRMSMKVGKTVPGARLLELHDQGKSLAEIARETKISPSTLAYRLRGLLKTREREARG